MFATKTHMLSFSCRSGSSCAGIVDWGAAARKGACFTFLIFKKNEFLKTLRFYIFEKI